MPKSRRLKAWSRLQAPTRRTVLAPETSSSVYRAAAASDLGRKQRTTTAWVHSVVKHLPTYRFAAAIGPPATPQLLQCILMCLAGPSLPLSQTRRGISIFGNEPMERNSPTSDVAASSELAAELATVSPHEHGPQASSSRRSNVDRTPPVDAKTPEAYRRWGMGACRKANRWHGCAHRLRPCTSDSCPGTTSSGLFFSWPDIGLLAFEARRRSDGCTLQGKLLDAGFEGDGAAGVAFEWLVEREGQDRAAFAVWFDRHFAGVIGVDLCGAGTYSSRGVRLSTIRTSYTSKSPVFWNRIVKVTTSPD